MNTPTTPKKIGALYAIDSRHISIMRGENGIWLKVIEFKDDKVLGDKQLDIELTQEMCNDLLQMCMEIEKDKETNEETDK